MLFVSSFCLHLAVTTDGVFLKANLGRRRCLRSLAVLKSGLRNLRNQVCRRWVEADGEEGSLWEVNRRARVWGEECHRYGSAWGDSMGRAVHRGSLPSSVSPPTAVTRLTPEPLPMWDLMSCVTRASGICQELSLDRPCQLGLPRAQRGAQGRGPAVLAGAALQRGRAVTEAGKTRSLGPFPISLLPGLLHTVDLAELSGRIKWL